MLSFIFTISLIGVTFGHNWLNSPSRTGDGSRPQKASTRKPAPNANGGAHVQVNPGQDFQVEWVIGHNRHTYFTLINKKDQDMMQRQTTRLLDQYFNEAPDGMKGPPPKKYAKYHRKATMDLTWDAPSVKGVQQPQIANFFQRRVPSNDPFHQRRDPIFKGSFRGGRRHVIAPDDVYQFEYKAREQRTDRWAYYKNDNMPWIIGSARYVHSKHQPSRPDFTLINIPQDADHGEYIVQYIWSGYYDAIDIQVIPNVVTQPYGMEIPADQIPPPAVYSRIDHCWYPESTMMEGATCIGLTGPDLNPRACLDQCSTKKDLVDCNAVVVIPLNAAPQVYSGFKDVTMAPFSSNQCTKPSNGETHVCYALKTRAGDALKFQWYATTDPEDPAFYSTCYQRTKPRVGFMTQESSFDPPAWEYRGHCVSCADRRKWSDATKTPFWSLTSQCVNCEARNGSGKFDPDTVLYTPFDEANGKVAADAVTGQQFALKGGAQFVPGVVGNAVKFGGNNNDYVELGNLSVPGNKFTVCAWANFERFESFDPRVISKTIGFAQGDHTFMLSSDGDTNNFKSRFRLRINGQTEQLIGDTNLKTNTWQHWCGTYDGARMKLWLDGKEVASGAFSGNMAVNNDPITVGGNTDEVGKIGRPMRGMVDDVRILKKALSAQEIADLIALRQ